MKKVSRAAVAILISLGVAACQSSGGGHQAKAQDTAVNAQQPANGAAAGKKEGEANAAGGKQAGAEAGAAGAGAASGAQSGAEAPAKPGAAGPSETVASTGGQNAANAPAATGASSGSTGRVGRTGAQQNNPAFVSLVTESQQQDTKTAIAKLSENETPTAEVKKDALSSKQDGDKITGHKQVYASYIVVTKGAGDTQTVKYYTGFTDNALAQAKDVDVATLDATYRGKLSLSNTKKDADSADSEYLFTHSTDVTFTVKNSKIKGTATFTPDPKKPNDTVVLDFKEANIQKQGDALGFNGSFMLTDNIPQAGKNLTTTEGAYHGVFAGTNAAELAGKFEEKDKRYEGAFAAKKETKATE